jgi:hypothetical protein
MRQILSGGTGQGQQSDGTPNVPGYTGDAGHIKQGNVQGTQSIAANGLDQTLIEIATIDVEFANGLGVEISITAQALDQFTISARYHASGSYQTLYSLAGEYTSPSGILKGTSGDLTAISAGSTGWFIMDVRGIESIQIKAACAADNGSSDVYWSAS